MPLLFDQIMWVMHWLHKFILCNFLRSKHCSEWNVNAVASLDSLCTGYVFPFYRIAGNFRLEKIFAFFAQACCGRKFFRQIILPSENFVMLKFFTRTGFYTRLPSSTSSTSWSLISCFTWYSKPLLSVIWELHPLLPGEQLALWAKLNSAKFLYQYKVWALNEIFIQRKFCAIQYYDSLHMQVVPKANGSLYIDV